MRVSISFFILLLASNVLAQEFDLKLGMPLPEVYQAMNGKYKYDDTTTLDARDPEGNWIMEKVRFMGVDFYGVNGFLIVNVNKRKCVTSIVWVRLFSSDLSIPFSLSGHEYFSPEATTFRSYNDSFKSDSKIADFERAKLALINKYGKGKMIETDEVLMYTWKLKTMSQFVELKEGELWYYCGKK